MPHALAMDVDLGNNDAIDPVPLAPSDHSIPSQVLRPTCGSRPPQRQQTNFSTVPSRSDSSKEGTTSKMTVKQLQQLCREQNLSTPGWKADLVARLAAQACQIRIEDDIGDAGENDPGGQDDASLIHCRSQLR
ncbi:hypothetical protein P692DRAFT_20879309 [Suillus brevipes Sb2]|nr:hypothetical protein P692DRAFT_20879309 [Suillus brevipes Sb2]